jgi:hypothetical protein
MTPTWAVILVGLGSAVLGSLLTTFLTISHERAAEFRSRMLNAADQFSTAAIAARQQTRDTAGTIMDDDTSLVDEAGSFKPSIKAQLDAANRAVDDVFAKEARVHLLFAGQSAASIAAAGAAAHLQHMLMALEHRPNSIHDLGAMLTYSRNFSGTQEQHEKFNREARIAIRDTWWSRFQRWSVEQLNRVDQLNSSNS